MCQHGMACQAGNLSKCWPSCSNRTLGGLHTGSADSVLADAFFALQVLSMLLLCLALLVDTSYAEHGRRVVAWVTQL